MPGLPTLAFLTLGSVLGTIGFAVQRAEKDSELEPVVEAPEPDEGTVDRATAFLKIDSLAVEIGYGLVGIVDAQQGGDFLG